MTRPSTNEAIEAIRARLPDVRAVREWLWAANLDDDPIVEAYLLAHGAGPVGHYNLEMLARATDNWAAIAFAISACAHATPNPAPASFDLRYTHGPPELFTLFEVDAFHHIDLLWDRWTWSFSDTPNPRLLMACRGARDLAEAHDFMTVLLEGEDNDDVIRRYVALGWSSADEDATIYLLDLEYTTYLNRQDRRAYDPYRQLEGMTFSSWIQSNASGPLTALLDEATALRARLRAEALEALEESMNALLDAEARGAPTADLYAEMAERDALVSTLAPRPPWLSRDDNWPPRGA